MAKINYKTRARRGRFIIVWLLIITFMAVALTNSKTSKDAAIEGLFLCYKYVIPSVFPFLIISCLIIETGLGEFIGITFGGFLSKILNISKSSAICYFLGTISGFPIGAKCAAELYSKGVIKKEEAERLCAICNPCSAPFILLSVGTMLLNNIKIGLLIWFFQFLFFLFYGIILGITAKKSKPKTNSRVYITKTYNLNFKVLTDAVKTSVTSMLNICGFVIFFSIVVKVVIILISQITENPFVFSVISGFFEMTSGIFYASNLELQAAIWTSTAVVVFSGMSVHMQVASFTSGAKINLHKYYIGKILAVPVVAGAVTLVCRILNYC